MRKKSLVLLFVGVGALLGATNCSPTYCPGIFESLVCVVVPGAQGSGAGGAGGAGGATGAVCRGSVTISKDGEVFDVITGTGKGDSCETCSYGDGAGDYNVRVELDGRVDELEVPVVEDECGAVPVRVTAFED
jgi:hypothetical protein